MYVHRTDRVFFFSFFQGPQKLIAYLTNVTKSHPCIIVYGLMNEYSLLINEYYCTLEILYSGLAGC